MSSRLEVRALWPERQTGASALHGAGHQARLDLFAGGGYGARGPRLGIVGHGDLRELGRDARVREGSHPALHGYAAQGLRI